jgi:hypothetical protein
MGEGFGTALPASSQFLLTKPAQRLMDIEVAAVCGAAQGERGRDHKNQRNGYRNIPSVSARPD